MLTIIVAIAENNVIGKDNKLLWHIPEDLKRFKRITTGHTIIMGRKTFESIGKVLPNRKNVVLSNRYIEPEQNLYIVKNVEELQKYINSPEECFVIGGETIYNLLLPYTGKMYITKIYNKFEGDTYFPNIEEQEWKKIESKRGTKNDENPFDYEYITYIRK